MYRFLFILTNNLDPMKSVIGTLIMLAIIILLAYCLGSRKPAQREIIEPVNTNQQLQRNGDYLVLNATDGCALPSPVL
jgi:hypothetical protein